MAQTEDDSDLPQLFTQTVQNLSEFNSEIRQQRRRQTALDCTYASHLDRIGHLLLDNNEQHTE